MNALISRLESIWKTSDILALLLVCSAMAIALWDDKHPHSPGWSIGMLALMAGIMSLRPEMSFPEKLGWIMVLVAFTSLEVEAIRVNDEETGKTRDAQNHQFQQIVSELTTSLATSKAQYESTIARVNGVLEKTQQVAATAQSNLDEVVGKGSHPCVLPETVEMESNGSAIPLNIWNRGKNVLTGVDLFFEYFPEIQGPNIKGAATLITVGTLSPGWPKMLPITPGQPTSNGSIHYRIQIYTQNGFYHEDLYFRKSIKSTATQPLWAYQYSLLKPTEIIGPTKRYPHAKGRSGVSLPMKDCWRLEWSDGSK